MKNVQRDNCKYKIKFKKLFRQMNFPLDWSFITLTLDATTSI